MKKTFFSAVLFFVAAAIYAEGAGITSLNFLKISQSARASGMGEAFTGVADDVNAIFWNPAGLTQLTRHQVCLMHSAWLIDSNIEYAAYAIPMPGIGSIGIYGTYLNAGEIIKTTEDQFGNYQLTEEKASASNFNFSVAFAKKLSDFLDDNSVFSDMSAGLSGSFNSETIAGDSGGGIGFNFSTIYVPKYENFSLGMVIQNIGFSNNRPVIPSSVKLGFGYRFALEDILLPFREEGYFTFLENNASSDIDLIYYPVERIMRLNVGAENYWKLNKFHSVAARVGYKFGHDLGFVAGLTAGLGYRLTPGDSAIEIDYSLNPYGELGVSHKIALTAKFLGKPENRITVNKAEAAQYYKIGYDALYAKNYSEAIYGFSQCLKRDREYASAYIGIGACFLNTGKKDVAIKAYKKALELNPDNEKLRQFIENYEREKALKNSGVNTFPENRIRTTGQQ